MTDKIPYIVSTPDYRSDSAGIRVIFKLCTMLKENGYEVYVNAKKTIKGVPTIWGNENKLRQMIIDGAIAVYSEITKKNYLWSKNPVGWLLLYGSFDFERDGLIFAYDKIYNSGECETLTIVDTEDFFINDKEYDRKYNAVYLGKGLYDERMNNIPDKVIISRWPKAIPNTRQKVADLLKRCKALYTYDAKTALAAEARLCGCPVMILENGINTLESCKGSYAPVLGMTNKEIEIEKVKEECAEFSKIWWGQKDKNESEVIKFIKLTQEWARMRLNGIH